MVEQKAPIDISTFFHTILFAYQKTLKDILGSGEAALLHPILDRINLVENKKNLNFIQGKDLDEILENFLEELLKEGTVAWVGVEEVENEKFLFQVEGCKFASHTHDFLNTKDTTCLFALVVMAILQSVTGKKVRPTDSEFTATGTKTLIEFLSPSKKEMTLTH
jgi:SHS2 domain-containing protein